MRRGQGTLEGRSTVPPKTLIAHTALLTGMAPEVSGKTDNEWEPGEATVEVRTVFHAARAAGYRTAFLYSKPKLGYLVSTSVDVQALAPDDGVQRVRQLMAVRGRIFAVLHLSGLEHAGMRSGWLSPDYLAKARAIDAALAPLLDAVEARGRFLVAAPNVFAELRASPHVDRPEDGRLAPAAPPPTTGRFPTSET
jgi:predicted AlkP superfamily pyrophosphatase or phosphodiesterase